MAGVFIQGDLMGRQAAEEHSGRPYRERGTSGAQG